MLLTAAFQKQYIGEREALMVQFLGMGFGDWAHTPVLPYSLHRPVPLPSALTNRHPPLAVVPAHDPIKEKLGADSPAPRSISSGTLGMAPGSGGQEPWPSIS